MQNFHSREGQPREAIQGDQAHTGDKAWDLGWAAGCLSVHSRLHDTGLPTPTRQARTDLLCTVGEMTYIRRIEVFRVIFSRSPTKTLA